MDFWHATCLYSMVFAICCTISGAAIEQCGSPQYLELGKAGVINCSFQKESLGLLWYKSTENTTDTLIMKVWDSVKDGRGYDSGEYDIFLNGSLWINNVTSMQDGNFTVVKFRSLEEDEEQFTVVVITTVKPSTRQPLIQGCMSKNTTCFSKSSIASEVVCVVRNARPSISLDWILRTAYGDRNLTSEVTVEHNGITSTTVAITKDAFNFTSVLSLLVCKAHSLPQMFYNDETSVLLENNNTNLLLLTPVQKFIERNSKLELRCSETDINLIVWKKSNTLYDNFEPILYTALFDEAVSMTHFDSYELNPDGSLLVPHTDIANEGLYECAYETDVAGNRALFNVTIYVPAYPVVVGCNKYQYCVLEAEKEGSLTCSVTGIRPLVNLDVGPLNEHDSSSITFTEREVTVNNAGEVYDIRMILKYRIQEAFRERLSLECRISGANAEILKSTTKFDLLFSSGVESTTKGSLSSGEHNYWIIAVVLVLVLVFIVACGLLIFKGHGKRQHPTNSIACPGEAIPMILQSQSTDEKKDALVSELKAKYQNLYDAVQPIPYIRDRLYCVDRVFVEGGIEYLVAKEKIGGQGVWEKLDTYHNILNDSRVKSIRRILEGEPGYGKSTLTLQFAYDWCNEIPDSYLKDTELLILLRLRQLGGVTSIYRAIRQFLLPKDSQLTENDVKNVLSNISSVVVVLDGYDEYPDQVNCIDSDVISIILRNMFQQFEVILTTRPSYLPKKYPALTKRLKLTGFDDNARDQYIRKAVVGDDVEAADKIKQRLKENPVLGDLCQVPLFFVMFAHMSHESDQFQKFNTATSFFRYMISCFHDHMKNKTDDKNVKQYDLYETDHRELDKLAFEGLSGKDQQIVWSKKVMCERLGKDFYAQYVRIGILVEEEVLDISSEHIQYKKEVRFYHKLFCEWYAANHLSKYASRDDVTFDSWEDPKASKRSDSDKKSLDDEHVDEPQDAIESQTDHFLKYLDPFDLQYVYRFTCGINPIASEKVIGYLKTRKDANKFSILCILEKSGKVEDVLKDVEDLCSGTVQIHKSYSLLLQRSTIQLLEIALANKISISHVYLFKCYSTMYLSGGYHLQLKSNLYIPVLTTLNELTIDTYDEGKEIRAEEFTDILQYSSKCLALKELMFWFCLLPQSVQAESVSILRSRNVKVIWGTTTYTYYQLNLQSCLWERLDGRVMTDDDYQSEVRGFRARYGIK